MLGKKPQKHIFLHELDLCSYKLKGFAESLHKISAEDGVGGLENNIMWHMKLQKEEGTGQNHPALHEWKGKQLCPILLPCCMAYYS